jgi:hypothetical protein
VADSLVDRNGVPRHFSRGIPPPDSADTAAPISHRKTASPYLTFQTPSPVSSIAASTSFSAAIYGSRKRSTVSWAQLSGRPSAMASSTICLPGAVSSTPAGAFGRADSLRAGAPTTGRGVIRE